MPYPLITILIPVYNAEEFVRSAMVSLLSQNYQNLEVICINDGSTDGSGAILDDLANVDTRVRVFHTPNQGLVSALNFGLEKATGSLIARMDADDVSSPDRIEKQVAYLEMHPDVGILGSQILITNQEAIPIKTSDFPLDHEGIKQSLLQGRCAMAHSSIMVKREVFEQLQGYRQCVAEDYDLFLRASQITRFANLETPMVLYRSHINGLYHSFRERNCESMIESLRTFISERNLDPSILIQLQEKAGRYRTQSHNCHLLPRSEIVAAWRAGNLQSVSVLGRKLWKRSEHTRKTLYRWIVAEAGCLLGRKNRDGDVYEHICRGLAKYP